MLNELVTPPAGQWVFDRLPPSGARRGGDPSEHAFNATLETFVREVVQNANDQAVDQSSRRSAVHFDHYTLKGGKLVGFLKSMDAERLFRHIAAAVEMVDQSKLRRGLDEAKSSLSLLRIADYHTHGLSGDEDASESHFRALCKDTLVSYKQGDAAGGSYGLGKSVLWSFSSLSTVLFSSTFGEEKNRRLRMIGRTEISSHSVHEHGYGGAGWFGEPRETPEGRRAESLWDDSALAQSLHLDRQSGTGTSILILGFHDPTTDESLTTEQLLDAIRRAAAQEFWPALAWPRTPLEIFVQGKPIDVHAMPMLRPLVDCWTAQSKTVAQAGAGSIQSQTIDIKLPRRRSESKPVQAQARLTICLGDPDDQDPWTNETAVFRGPGMIVERWQHKNLGRSVRPFSATLACGLARDPGRATAEDRALEHFLRCCEPPGHDTWRATRAVKNEYVQGYGKALKHLHSEVDGCLRKALLGEGTHTTEAPEHIRKLFPLFGAGSSSGTRSAFTIYDLDARLTDEHSWEFEGSIRPSSPGRLWRAEIRIFEVGDDGKPIGDAIDIAEIEPEGARCELRDGFASIIAERGARTVSFVGQSIALVGRPETFGAICVEVNAHVELSGQ